MLHNLWVDDAEVVRILQDKEVTPLALDYNLYRTTLVLETKIQFSLSWAKVDSHIEEKLKMNPLCILQGNPLAWRLNEAVIGAGVVTT